MVRTLAAPVMLVSVMLVSVMLVSVVLASLPAAAAEPVPAHGFAMHGDLKYGPEFTHFDYVDPDAAKGGTVRQEGIGSFDSLNPYILKGNTAAGLD
ncbi:MAG: hypothetical protein ACREER_10090, partial [Alphaproteobacteria bacterium]